VNIRRVATRLNWKYRTVLWRVNRRLRDKLTVRTRQGIYTLQLDKNESIDESLFVRGEYELDLIEQAMPVVRDLTGKRRGDGAVLDIGANNGVISIGMLVSGETERAVAIEPEPQNFACLKRNIAQNNLAERFTCINMAASEGPGKVNFLISPTSYGDHAISRSGIGSSTINIDADSLSGLMSRANVTVDDLAVIWVDIQGHEGYMFAGARDILRRGPPVVCEFWPFGIRRAGMTPGEYCEIVTSIWPHFWIERRGHFVEYPISIFATLFDEFGCDGEFGNVILAQ
jgi:FkbM family methyltransferase